MRFRHLWTALVVTALLAGCGDDDDVPTGDTTTSSVVESSTTTTTSTPTTAGSTPATGEDVVLDQAAIWPAPAVVFDTPEAAASDFVENVLGVPVSLGEFQQGDSRSGEIEVFSGADDGGDPVVRGLLLLRQIGPTDGWYVLGAANDNATVESPEPFAEVAAGPVTVSGVARGFEAVVTVRAHVAGEPTVLDEVQTTGGSAATPEPYEVTLDLGGAEPGDVVMILVRGGTGNEADPGEFGAIGVVIAS